MDEWIDERNDLDVDFEGRAEKELLQHLQAAALGSQMKRCHAVLVLSTTCNINVQQ